MTTPTLDARSDVLNGLTRRRFLGGMSLVALPAACGGESDRDPSTTDEAIEGSGAGVEARFAALDRIVPMLAAALDGDPAPNPPS